VRRLLVVGEADAESGEAHPDTGLYASRPVMAAGQT
jgi:hypothetical protein